jgi:hypothetical protein
MTQTYAGGCQCEKVRFTVELALGPVNACNCSRCQKLGSLFAFVPASGFSLTSGGEALTDFQFNNRVIQHLFCATCGIESFAKGTGPDGTEMVAINVRCLDDVDVDALEVKHIDGRSY